MGGEIGWEWLNSETVGSVLAKDLWWLVHALRWHAARHIEIDLVHGRRLVKKDVGSFGESWKQGRWVAKPSPAGTRRFKGTGTGCLHL